MTPRFLVVAGLALLTALSGCIFTTETEPPKPVNLNYLPLDKPENLVNNLEVSYRRRDIVKYAELLHPEFIFRFQPEDFQDVGAEFWTRTRDSLKTERLFTTTEVSKIEIDISAHSDPVLVTEPPEPELEGTTFIRVTRTFLEVDQVDGITWQVNGDIQDMYFKRGDGAASDSTRWYLLEWRDIKGNAFRTLDPLSEDPAPRPAALSWGRMRDRF